MGLFGGSKSVSTTNVTEVQETQNQSFGSGTVADAIAQGNDNLVTNIRDSNNTTGSYNTSNVTNIDEFSDKAKAVYDGLNEDFQHLLDAGSTNLKDTAALIRDTNTQNSEALKTFAKAAQPDVSANDKLLAIVGALGLGLIILAWRR
jgi:hypothetical protein